MSEFARLESSDAGEIIVRFVEPVKYEMASRSKKPHPEEEQGSFDETESLKRRIEEEVAGRMAEAYLPESRVIVCKTPDELVRAIEKAKAAFMLSRTLARSGRYAPPLGLGPSPSQAGHCVV